MHVADRVEVHESGDRRDHDEHYGGERVHAQRPVDLHRPGGEPIAEDRHARLRRAEADPGEDDPREKQADEEQACRHHLARPRADEAAEASGDDKAE